MSAKDTIAVQCYGLSAKELNEFLSFYPIPSEYDVILPKSTETIFDAPPSYVGFYTHSFLLPTSGYLLLTFCEYCYLEIVSTARLYLVLPRNFIYIKGDDDLAFLSKEPSSGFGTGSPSASVNTELPKDAAEWEYSCPSRVVRAKNSASKDDDPILSISDDDEGLPNSFKLKDANSCHLKISAITPPAWKGHLDNQMDLEILDLHDRCYARQAMVDNTVNRRAREFLQVIEKMRGEADVIKARERSYEEEYKELRVKCEDAMAEFDHNPAILVLREKISSLTADVKGHKEKARLEAVDASLCREVEELKQDRRDVVSKVISYAALELVHSNKLGRLVGTLVSSTITYGRCRAYEQVAAMKEPFDLSKAKGYRTLYKKDHTQASNDFATATFLWLDEFVADSAAPIEALLSKKPPTLQNPAPSRTQMPVPSF
ncbi:hypothetical protein Tco_1145723 [Tanacetum coccineum]